MFLKQNKTLFPDEEWEAMASNSVDVFCKIVCKDSNDQVEVGTLHQTLCQNLNFTGNYQMPCVTPIICDIPQRIVAYYRTTTGKYKGYVPHFYTDDKHFESLWTHPFKAVKQISSNTSLIIGPDFSVYADMVFAQKIWNIFRNKLLVAWWQFNGIHVIPNVSWINENYECSFEGWPKNSVIAVNSTGVGKSKRCKRMWISGYKKMLEYLKPVHILRYGAKQEGENESISTYYSNDNFNIVNSHGRK